MQDLNTLIENMKLDQPTNYYRLFIEFLKNYSEDEFRSLDYNDPLIQELEKTMLKNIQFFYLADMIRLNILHVSSTITNAVGIEPLKFDPEFEYATTHPGDLKRHSVTRGKLIRLCCELFNTNDYRIMSNNMRSQHSDGRYINWLNQAIVFALTKPRPKVFGLFIKTDIDWFGPIKHGYHFNVGKDLTKFRLPDEELINSGYVFTDREYEILSNLRLGLDSRQIGEKLFISPHTVDTHRRNILKKTGFHHTSDLIIDLQNSGFF